MVRSVGLHKRLAAFLFTDYQISDSLCESKRLKFDLVFLSVNYSHVNVIVHTPFLIGRPCQETFVFIWALPPWLQLGDFVLLSY